MIHQLLPMDELAAPGEQSPRWQVLDPHLVRGRVKLFNCLTNAEEYKLHSELNDALAACQLEIRRAGMPMLSAADQADPRLDVSTQRAMDALREIADIQRQCGVSFARAYVYARQSRKPDQVKDFPPRSTVYRYAKAVRNGLPPLRGHANKGNRTARYSDDIVQFIRQKAKAHYLVQASKWTLLKLTERVNDVAVSSGWIGRRKRISKDYIRKTVKSLSPDPSIDRMDPKLVSASKSVAGETIRVTGLLERVEQDALHMPFVVTTPHGSASNVWLVHAIDCCTGMPVGWKLKIGAPSARDGLECFGSILFPKRRLIESLGVAGLIDIDPYGKPLLVVFDNGPEAKNERMFRVQRLGSVPKYCRSHQPQGKPFIERLNGLLKTALETLPGCTRMDGKDGMRDPIAEGDVLMTLEELEAWVVDWYYNNWAHTELDRLKFDEFGDFGNLGTTPAKRWARMTGELAFAAPLSPSLTEWRRVLYDHHVRKLNLKSGITYECFSYRGPNVKYLIAKLGEASVNVLSDPDDYRQVFVDLGDGSPLIPLTEKRVTETSPAYTVEEEKARRNGTEPDEDSEDKRREQRLRTQEYSEQADRRAKPPRKTKAQRNREVADKTNTDRAIKTASVKPLKTYAPVLESGPPPEASGMPQQAFDDIAPLPVLSRRDGGTQR